jgi:hypothetical protein
MKYSFLLIILLLSFTLLGISDNPKKGKNNKDSTRSQQHSNIKVPDFPLIVSMDSVYKRVEERAYFSEGTDAMNKFISKYLIQPKPKRELEITVGFVVERYGAISKVYVVKGGDYTDESAEAIKVVRKMLSWEPAKIRGQRVASYNELTIPFGKRK